MNNDDRKLKKNELGYSDPTAYKAIKNIETENEKARKLIEIFKTISKLSGFDILGRIALVSRKTGRVWR